MLADFLIRLRCQACRSRPPSAVLIDGVSSQAAAQAAHGAQPNGGWNCWDITEADYRRV
jgi:hypothetical protein